MSKVKCRQCKKTIDKDSAILVTPRMYVCSEICKNLFTQKNKMTEKQTSKSDTQMVCKHCGKNYDESTDYFWAHKSHFCSQKCAKEHLGVDEFYLGMMLDIVWTLCEKQSNFFMLRKQAETLHNTNNWSYSGMYLTVKYYIEILELGWNQEWGLGQIFSFNRYEEARIFYSQKYNVSQQLSDLESIQDTEVTFYIQEDRRPDWKEKYIDSLSDL